MLIGDDSPLRRLPSGLNIKQTLFLDAIRYCVEMADIAYSRLQQNLLTIGHEHRAKREIMNLGPLGLHVMLDAWSIIDLVFRLRILLKRMPGVKKSSPGFMLFDKNTSGVDSLRNSIQHIDKEIDILIANKSPVLGVLTWIVCPEPTGERLFIFQFQPGTLFKRSVQLIKWPKSVRSPIDMITLIHTQNICLSYIMDEVTKLISSFEKQLKEQTKDLPQAGADLLIFIELEKGKVERKTQSIAE